MTVTTDVAGLIEKQGGARIGDVILYPNPKPADRYIPHRNRPSNPTAQSFSMYDDEGTAVYRSVQCKMPTLPVQPRHRHDFDQIRFILSGEWENDRKRYGAGMLGYFPEGVHYGPQVWATPGRWIVMQFAGPSNTPMMAEQTFIEAANKLKEEEGVVFQDGICVWPDGRKQDGAEVVAERLYGRKMTYPPARYNSPVWFNTNEIPWEPTAIAGVSVKHLGFFNSHGPAMEMIQLAPGASLPAGNTDRRVTRFVIEGATEYESVVLPAEEDGGVSNICYLPGSDYASLSSKTGATILSVELDIPTGSTPFLV